MEEVQEKQEKRGIEKLISKLLWPLTCIAWAVFVYWVIKLGVTILNIIMTLK